MEMEREQMLMMAERICGLLQVKSMSCDDLAREAGVTEAAARRYAFGERQPRGPILLNVAKALGTTADFLLGRTDEPFGKSDEAAGIKASVPLTAEERQMLEKLLQARKTYKERKE